MPPRTSGWTDGHSWVAGVLGTGAVATLAGVLEPSAQAWWVAVVVLAVGVASLALDALGGLVVGLLGAAALVAVKRLAGDWGDAGFWVALVETGALLLLGGVAGTAGRALRRAGAPTTSTGAGFVGADVLDPAFGSLGLLGRDLGLARVEEELERARRFRRPLSLVFFEVEIIDGTLDAAASEAATRAVARLVENRCGETDVPFALDPRAFGVVLPETAGIDAWDLVGRVVDAVTMAQFTSRTEGHQRSLADAVDVRAGLAERREGVDSTDALVDAAMAGLRQARRDDDATTHDEARS